MFRTPQNNAKSCDQHIGANAVGNAEGKKSNCCGQCNMEDTGEMVQCDKCDTWYHFPCAGVTNSVENHEWMCSKCTGKAADDNKSARKSVSERSVMKSKIVSTTSSRQRKINLELQQLEEEKVLEARFLQRKFEILAMSEKDEGSIRSAADSRTRKWVSKLSNYPPSRYEDDAHYSPTRCECTHKSHGAVPKKLIPEEESPLKNSQLLARKALSKDLPIFSGKPEEWPLFYSSFEESTHLCGYSDTENLLRLQKCLKGKALEAVSCHLLLPKNVLEVIRTLRMMFGRPEIIITSLLEKIRSEPAPKADKLDSLVSYAISVRNLCSTLEASGLEAHKNNPLLLQELVDKLPAQIKLQWAMYVTHLNADISTFSKWLFDIAEAVTKVNPYAVSYKTGAHLHTHNTEETSVAQNLCPLCDKNHLIEVCNKFSHMKLQDRWDKVRQLKLCRLCLKKHGNYRCSDVTCSVQGCEARHHKLLHKFRVNTTVTAHSSSNSEATTYFKILPVTLHNKDKSIETYAFLDDGSNVTLLEKEICDQLGLEGDVNNLCLKWTSETSRTEEDSMQVVVRISGCKTNSKRYELFNVRTVKNLSLPTQSVTKQDLEGYSHLKNVPYSSYTGATPKILIGLNNGHVCNSMKTIEGTVGEPCASKTRLGWVIHGGNDSLSTTTLGYHKIEHCNCDYEMEKLQNIVSNYLSLENIGRKHNLMSPEDQRGNLILQTTTKRIGKMFETGLIWKEDLPEIPNSFPMALKRLQCLEKKTDPKHIPIVTQNINALVEKGYARKLSADEAKNTSGITWYLPIFTVINPNKLGKIRLVWDAAAKVRGVSLNSMLLKGPDLMSPLLSVLYGFRMNKFAICGDIKEMFHQVVIRKEDQNAQRFIWRNGEVDRRPDVYLMQVMTFGAACSPSSAQYVKNMNALEFKNEFPRAVESIINHHYVDDLLDCTHTEREAIDLAKQVSHIHRNAGFFIRNWKSNSKAVMESLGELEEQNNVSIGPNIVEITTERVLGMWWSTSADVFTFSLKLNRVNKDVLSGIKKPTKTDILRTLMSIFDPFGFLSSYVVYLKILLQEVWRTTVGWTDLVNDNIFKKWLVWIELLPNIENVRIPRWYSIQPNSSIQLHVFVDASELAYAAVAYFRVLSPDGVQCSLISSKVKVAPKQPVSIPRMELMAAVLGVRLANSICNIRNLNLERRWFWSDSNTVLSLLNSDPRNFKQFVMFRIGEVLDCSKSSEWRYIPSKENVADDATKWKTNFKFDMSNRWFDGPNFLKENECEWPTRKLAASKSLEELRPHIVMLHTKVTDLNVVEFSRFSSWSRLLRTVVKVYTFIHKLRMKQRSSRNEPYLVPETTKLFEMAEHFLYRQMQTECFKDESAVLRSKCGEISKSSVLYKCSPYMDENEVIRINGRIGLAVIPENAKRPIILPRSHYCTGLLIQHFHEKFHHIHHETCLNELRQCFYIPRLRVELKKVRRNCQLCKNSNASPVVPEMATLPKARLSNFSRPFSYVGIDYFGPLYVKVARHEEKRWGVLFTCLTIRAIHIEVARDMTTDSCIMAIQNFIARRGTPIAIYCDNGTNFRGAETELKNAIKNVDFDSLAIKFTTSSTTWHFNPPAAPHMGGSWERLVQSVKKVLHQVTPSFVFKDDTLYNGLLECERIINSRPLTYVDLESTTDEALTPNHFLLGSSNGEKPLGVFTGDDCVLRKNWRKVQYFADLFWKRWTQEYLPTITKRTKWFKKCSPLEVDDVVIICDPNLPRNNWPRGIIQSVCKSKDGNVRSASVLTNSGIFNRPVAKLAKLDVRRTTGP